MFVYIYKRNKMDNEEILSESENSDLEFNLSREQEKLEARKKALERARAKKAEKLKKKAS
jgi:hypothetical protein